MCPYKISFQMQKQFQVHSTRLEIEYIFGGGDVTRDCDIFMIIMFPWLLHIRDVAYLGRGGV